MTPRLRIDQDGLERAVALCAADRSAIEALCQVRDGAVGPLVSDGVYLVVSAAQDLHERLSNALSAMGHDIDAGIASMRAADAALAKSARG
ncbi:MAG: hypothetical protein FWD74_06300 [Actinomycetia bacterium]|nr:hypothetical protein [Actinomycetes bacterium]